MAFRQTALPPLSRRYSNSSHQQVEEAVLASSIRGRSTQHESQLGPVSDFGSLNTISKTEGEELSDIIEDLADDLDSLDEGLQAFREPSLQQNSEFQHTSILPTHDGLGSFHPARDPLIDRVLPHEHSTSNFQVQFVPFSRFDEFRDRNSEEESLESSRHDRIERWRLEQSKILLEEIEKERQRAETNQKLKENKVVASEIKQDSNRTLEATASLEEPGLESIWQKLARHVMKDFIGLDDTVLSVIFGEDLMLEESSMTPTPAAPLHALASQEGISRGGLFARLIKELQTLAQRLSTDTLPSQEQLTQPFDYAGIPLSWLETDKKPLSPLEPTTSAQFQPTLQTIQQPKATHPEITIPESEYWEQTPNLKSVITYLYGRLRTSPSSGSPPETGHSKLLSSTYLPLATQDPLRRAAIIREHHPLTSRHYSHGSRRKHYRQASLLSSHKAGSIVGVPHFSALKRPGSSCASWSTKRSRRAESSGSRNYWDLGESVGSGSMVFTGVGAWGEV